MNRIGKWSCYLVTAMLIASCGGKTTHKDGKPNIVEAMRADPLITQLIIPNATPQNVVASGGGGNGPGGSVAQAFREWKFNTPADRDAMTLSVLSQLHVSGIRLDRLSCFPFMSSIAGPKLVGDETVDVLVAVDSQKVTVRLATDGSYPTGQTLGTFPQDIGDNCPEQLKQAAQAVNQPRSNT